MQKRISKKTPLSPVQKEILRLERRIAAWTKERSEILQKQLKPLEEKIAATNEVLAALKK